tara:strand:+ start:515 stop:886 length:372 start_codon:yes stop_codon:yes gene_type:complete
MKFIKTYESFSSLTEEQKIKLQTIVNNITDSSMEKVPTNSEVANPRGKARNPFYDKGMRPLQGLGKPFGSIVPGSVNKEKDVITAEVSHGVNYESGLKKEYKSIIKMDAKTLEYEVEKIETGL